jgi:hypothetical protein
MARPAPQAQPRVGPAQRDSASQVRRPWYDRPSWATGRSDRPPGRPDPCGNPVPQLISLDRTHVRLAALTCADPALYAPRVWAARSRGSTPSSRPSGVVTSMTSRSRSRIRSTSSPSGRSGRTVVGPGLHHLLGLHRRVAGQRDGRASRTERRREARWSSSCAGMYEPAGARSVGMARTARRLAPMPFGLALVLSSRTAWPTT